MMGFDALVEYLVVLGAKKAGIESVGLRYGFAEKDELENAGADYILEKVEDILPFLNQM